MTFQNTKNNLWIFKFITENFPILIMVYYFLYIPLKISVLAPIEKKETENNPMEKLWNVAHHVMIIFVR